MFHVYGVGGRLYSGGAENIPVVPVQRVERLDPIHTFMVDERPPEEPTPHRSTLANDAVAAYGQAAAPTLAPTRLPRVVALSMTSAVVTVQADASLADAAAWMIDRQVGQAPVIDERQQLIGLLGRAQILAHMADMAVDVRSVMVSPVPAALPDTDVHLVAKVMLRAGVSGLPVVDADGNLCGFIARGDLLGVLADEPALEVWA